MVDHTKPSAFRVECLNFKLSKDLSGSGMLIYDEAVEQKHLAIFAHGYTAHKAQQSPWAFRLADLGVTTVVCDLPGHKLGNYHPVSSFELFSEHAHKVFPEAVKAVVQTDRFKKHSWERLIFGGHSLGAFLALQSQISMKEGLQGEPIEYIGVGLGINRTENNKSHFLETSLFARTLQYRNQLVSECMQSDVLFPWLKEAKLKLVMDGAKVNLLTGKDDLIAPPEQLERLKEVIEKSGDNTVKTHIYEKLPHHEPERAAPFIYKLLKGTL